MLWLIANVSGCVDWGLGLLPLACWDSGAESRRQHGWLSLMSVVCCQVEVFASDWSHIQRNPSEYGECECDREAWMMMRPWPTRGCCVMEKNVLSDYWLMEWKWSGRIGCVLNDILFFTPTPTPTPHSPEGTGEIDQKPKSFSTAKHLSDIWSWDLPYMSHLSVIFGVKDDEEMRAMWRPKVSC